MKDRQIGLKKTACPHCGSEARAMWRVGDENREEVIWCAGGHVIIAMRGLVTLYDPAANKITELGVLL